MIILLWNSLPDNVRGSDTQIHIIILLLWLSTSFCLVGTVATLILFLFASLFLPRDSRRQITKASIWIQPFQRSEMTEHIIAVNGVQRLIDYCICH